MWTSFVMCFWYKHINHIICRLRMLKSKASRSGIFRKMNGVPGNLLLRTVASVTVTWEFWHKPPQSSQYTNFKARQIEEVTAQDMLFCCGLWRGLPQITTLLRILLASKSTPSDAAGSETCVTRKKGPTATRSVKFYHEPPHAHLQTTTIKTLRGRRHWAAALK